MFIQIIRSFKCSGVKSNTKWQRGLARYCIFTIVKIATPMIAVTTEYFHEIRNNGNSEKKTISLLNQ